MQKKSVGRNDRRLGGSRCGAARVGGEGSGEGHPHRRAVVVGVGTAARWDEVIGAG